MNSSHYPDLDRCRKLTEIGFPVDNVEKIYYRTVGNICNPDWTKTPFEFSIQKRALPWEIRLSVCTEEYLCPSIMELLDVIVKYTKPKDNSVSIIWGDFGLWWVSLLKQKDIEILGDTYLFR